MRSRYHKSHIALVLMSSFMISSCAPFMVRDYQGDADNHPVKILVLKTSGSVTISSRKAMYVYRNDTLVGNDTLSGLSLNFNPDNVKSAINVEPGNEPVMVNGQPYRGSLIIRRHNDGLMIINVLPIDEYLMSVVPGEIPANWDKEALRAQAVAARTFTYYHIKTSHSKFSAYDLDATVATQVYRGIIDEKPQTTEAVKDTSGQIMVYEDKPILSYFHSTCGGKTIDDRYVWEKSHLPYLQGITCGFCNDSTRYSWESKLHLAEIHAAMLKKYPAMGAIRAISFKKKDDRVVEVLINNSRGTIRMNGNNFRLMFSPEKIRSLYFTSKKDSDGLVLKGHGWGHGVGLCQWGARGMAMRGYSYREILSHYYMGVKIASVRNSYIASKHKNLFNYQ
jgi:stage II sporulation protein D